MSGKAIGTFLNNGLRFIVKNRTKIAAIVGLVGGAATIALTGIATVKATKIIEEENRRREEANEAKVTKKEAIKLCWKFYILPATVGSVSFGSLIYSASATFKQNAALAAACTLSETAVRDYKKIVGEVIGDKNLEEVNEKLADNVVAKVVPENTDMTVYTAQPGNCLCIDGVTGVSFMGNWNDIKTAINNFNERLLVETTLSLNEFYDELSAILRVDIVAPSVGDVLGFDLQRTGIMSANTVGRLKDNIPVLVILHNASSDYTLY